MSIFPKGKPLDRDPNDNPTKIFIAVLAGLSTLAPQSFALPPCGAQPSDAHRHGTGCRHHRTGISTGREIQRQGRDTEMIQSETA
jgi:hypothetical protein